MIHLPIFKGKGRDAAAGVVTKIDSLETLELKARIDRNAALFDLASKGMTIVEILVTGDDLRATSEAETRRYVEIHRQRREDAAELRTFAEKFRDRLTEDQFQQLFNATLDKFKEN